MKSKALSIFFVCSSMFITLASPVLAQSQTNAWTGKCVGGYVTAGTTVSKDPNADVATIQGIECLVANVLSTAITIIGIAAFVMFLIGSFQYLTAGANAKGVESGKKAISFAILGIVVALASFVILRFISTFTGIPTLMDFNTQI
ncbi:MAG: hypothetical protein ABI758_05080 [Candidatus Woesebacteria bacterium]